MSASSKYNLPPDLPLLPVDWIWKPLGELVQEDRGICYGIVQPGKYDESGIPMVNSGNIIDNKSGAEIEFKVSKSVHEKYKRSTLKGGEVLLTLVGANFGRSIVAPKSFVGFNCARPVGVIPVLDSSEYINFALQTPLIRHYMDNWANTTAQPTLNLSDVANLPIAWAPEKQRKIITKNIKSLDDKLNNNRKINQTLEQIAQAIFKSWFVDFEPTKAKIAAREALLADMADASKENNVLETEQIAKAPSPETIADAERQAAIQSVSGISGAVPIQQLEALADLFPNQLIDSELGEIPEGWGVKSLDKVAHYQNGLALQKFRPDKGEEFLPVLKISHLKAGFTDGKEVAKASIKPECIIDNGDVVFSWSASLLVDIWCGGKAALNQHLFKVTSKEYPKWFYTMWTKHHLEQFIQIASDKAVTMGHIKRSHLSEAKCVIPTNDFIELPIIGVLIDKQINTRLESNTLEQLRDSLLPKLLSGELPLEGDK